MSLTYSEMEALCKEIQPALIGSKVSDCIDAGDCHFVFSFETGQHLLVCLQEPFLRFHLLNKSWKSGSETPFEKHLEVLKGAVLQQMELLNHDRILKLTFKHGKSIYYFIAELFPKRSEAYLTNENSQIIAQLKKVPEEKYQIPEKVFNKQEESAKNSSSAIVEELYREKEKQAWFEHEKLVVQRDLSTKLKGAQRLKAKCEEALKASLEWQKLQHEGQLLVTNLHMLKQGMTTVSIPDWEKEGEIQVIKLDPTIPPKQEIEKRFKKSKKLRAGISHSESMIAKADKDIVLFNNRKKLLEEIRDFDELKAFQKQMGFKAKPELRKDSLELAKALPYREFYTAAGMKIWVGKSAKNNEELTFRYANGSDWWLHARDVPGSHVILKANKQEIPDEESIQDAAQIALHYSKAKEQGTGEVCLTQCKYVSRFGKGHVGKVQLSKHRVVHARFDPERLSLLKSRKPT